MVDFITWAKRNFWDKRASDNRYQLSSDGAVAGGYTLTLGSDVEITGDYTLTLGGDSTVNGSLVGSMTGGGTVATGGYTLTVPAAGTAALKSAAQTFTGLQTFSNGIAFANETLSAYDEGTWTPVLRFGGGSTGITYSTQTGRYTRIGQAYFFTAVLILTSKGSDTGNADITGLPGSYTTYHAVSVFFYLGTLTSGHHANALITNVSGSNAITLYDCVSGSLSIMQDTNFNNNTQVIVSGYYEGA